MKKITLLSTAFILFMGFTSLFAQDNAFFIDVLKKEVDSNLKNLRIANRQSPFFISYTLFDQHIYEFAAKEGALRKSYYSNTRNGFPFLLVGNYERTNATFGEWTNQIFMSKPASFPASANDEKGIAKAIRTELDDIYKHITDVYEKKMVALKSEKRSAEDLAIPDFEQRQAIQVFYPIPNEPIDKAYWENYVKKASEALKGYDGLTDSDISITIKQNVAHYYDTEGSSYVNPVYFYVMRLHVETQAENGDKISDDMFTEVSSLDRLPDLETYINSNHQFVKNFLGLKDAPKFTLKDSYNGPVLIQGMALCESTFWLFFLPNQLTAFRSFDMHNSPMEDMLGKKVIDSSLSITSLSGKKEYKGKALDGYIGIDMQAVVPDEELVLIENGILKNVLSGRTPTKKTRHSNGHMRFTPIQRNMTVITSGNVLVTSNNTMSNDQLKQKLIETAKEAGWDYTYIIKRMRWNVPIMMYKVYVEDGREELVHGAVVSDLNAKSFSRILGASDQEYMQTISPLQCLTTLIVPDGILFESLIITENQKYQQLISKPE